MPAKNIYVPDEFLGLWNEATSIAERRGSSISKVVVAQLRSFVRDQQVADVPVGFAVPASMKDPAAVKREQLADDIRALVVEHLERQQS